MRKRFAHIIVLLIVSVMLLSSCGKESDYKDAVSLFENGNYHDASIKFTELGDYKNSTEMVKTCRYAEAKSLFDAKQYEDARKIFFDLGDYELSKEMVKNCRYEEAKILLDTGKLEDARKIFFDLGDYEQSSEYVKECDYRVALELYDAGNLEAAIDALQKVSGYNDADKKIEEIKDEQIHQLYGPVFDALNGNTWFFNGGADTILNGISFEGDTARIAQVYYDGNGKHDNGSTEYPFTVDDKYITLSMWDGSELTIPYILSGETISLGTNEYYSLQEIDAGLQGYWKLRKSQYILGIKSVSEDNIYINNGKMTSESASLAYGSTNGEYYYYGPYQGSYTLNFGGFDTDMFHGSEWFFNIIDGKITLLNFDNVCTPSDNLPGEAGYKF